MDGLEAQRAIPYFCSISISSFVIYSYNYYTYKMNIAANIKGSSLHISTSQSLKSHKVLLEWDLSTNSACADLLKQQQHLPQLLTKQTSEQIRESRLRLKTSIDVVLYLALQGCAMRAHDESKNSTNRGNFLKLVHLLASYNIEVAQVLAKAPKSATYLSPDSQKDILEVIAEKVRWAIREEVGDAKFCIIVDESSDMSRKEQMAIVLRFVDKFGLVKERSFGLVHVANTSSVTLKNGIFSVLSSYGLHIMNIRGQGYDGASNMGGEWNGLQALVLNECPFAYYIHCFAHQLQLALVAASKEVIPVYQFFTKLNSIMTFVLGSSKRADELKSAYTSEIESLLEKGELETGTGLNLSTWKFTKTKRHSMELSLEVRL